MRSAGLAFAVSAGFTLAGWAESRDAGQTPPEPDGAILVADPQIAARTPANSGSRTNRARKPRTNSPKPAPVAQPEQPPKSTQAPPEEAKAEGADAEVPVQALDSLPAWRSALDAERDRLWGVVRVKAESILATARLSDQDQVKARLLLAQALVQLSDFPAALDILQQSSVHDQPTAKLWQGIAEAGMGKFTRAYDLLSEFLALDDIKPADRYAAQWALAQLSMYLDRWDKAQPLLEGLIQAAEAKQPGSDSSAAKPYASRARMLLIEGWLARGDFTNARKALDAIPVKDREAQPYYQLLLARCDLLSGKPAESLKVLTPLLDPAVKVPEQIHALAVLASGEARLAAGDAETAQDELLAFIEANPGSPLLPDAFFLLERAGGFGDSETLDRIESWLPARDAGANSFPLRSQLSAYWLHDIYAQRGERARAAALANQALELAAKSPVTQAIGLREISRAIQNQDFEKAEDWLKKLDNRDARVLFENARLAFLRGEFEKSATLFSRVARTSGTALQEIAAANAGVAWIRANKPDGINALSDIFIDHPELQADLVLERAIALARQRHPAAEAALEGFLVSHPGNPRSDAARLALAEVLLASPKPNLQRVSQLIDSMKKSMLADNSKGSTEKTATLAAKKSARLFEERQERLARLEMMLSEATSDWEALVKQASKYLELYPDSADSDMVRLKLGESYYRCGDFHDAVLALQPFASGEGIANRVSPSVRDAAIFLAAKAAIQSNTPQSLDKALTMFSRLMEGDGPLRVPATLESVGILLRQAKARDALKILEEMGKQPGLSPVLVLETRALMADAWMQLESEDPQALTHADEIFTGLIGNPGDQSLAWKRRVHFLRGQLRERQSRSAEALADYYSVVNGEAGKNTDAEREWYWLYQAGFAAMRLLEEQQDWKGAIALANRLAALGGPRSEEVAKRAKNLKLEHMIWED